MADRRKYDRKIMTGHNRIEITAHGLNVTNLSREWLIPHISEFKNPGYKLRNKEPRMEY